MDTYSAVEEIPKDDFLPISIVYDMEFQGTEACTIMNAERRNTDQRVAFVKSSNKVKKESWEKKGKPVIIKLQCFLMRIFRSKS
ncbi:hypothetical protein KGMB01110_28250 [Mediterraneibacter butyricigenes]|uniref:Uncharacterized protein n=1 Tax=Mediterraneibacter butyricigenes TaxID=2316025 RepID=A0A391PEV1_9FIRM|nr:hypothetical protein [Mediterraneibacter butyricigenes]GCA68389.1 hypothetical protein KGMB01110_28250 [Mediterraneibacter butyricigenes]